ncbi:MAG: response regulator, partial [Lachnospiraceae bacterium]|nr:response regulator [Lachnospiraceae bacterium]
WRSEQQNIVQTNNLVQSGVYVIYKGEYNDDTTSKIALSDHSPFQKIFAEMYYPDSEIIEVSSAKECLDAVKYGTASCTFFNTGRAEKYLAQNEYEMLNRLSINNNTYFCIGVKKGNNVVYSLLERGLALIDKSSMTNAIYKYTDSGIEYSLSTFIRNNLSIVLGIAALIIGLICIVAIMLAISLKRIKQQKNKDLENLNITTRQKEELEKAKIELQNAVTLAEQANFAKTSFLFNMSHDIRTPMNAILGFADLAEKHQDDPEKVQDYIKKIKESGDVLLSILNNVLEMSRIEKGTIFIEEQAWSIEQFTDSMFSMFNEQMVQKGLTFEKTVNVEHNYIYCDPPKIREIFINIIANAYKFTDKGGKVSLIIDELPSDKENQAFFKITVSDTGKGMSEDFLPMLFDEFAREKNSEKNTIEGTGLGMAIVKRLVDLMNGSIEVKSKLNEGSSFIITIPAKIASKEDVTIYSKREVTEDEFKGKRILLAEDNDINAEITETILNEEGFEVERAEDGLICLNKVKEKPAHYYDIVLMDIQMPNMNGYQASEAIRNLEDKEKSTIPILAVTANAFEEDKRQAIASGMNGHISKPIVVRDLIKALANTLGKQL